MASVLSMKSYQFSLSDAIRTFQYGISHLGEFEEVCNEIDIGCVWTTSLPLCLDEAPLRVVCVAVFDEFPEFVFVQRRLCELYAAISGKSDDEVSDMAPHLVNWRCRHLFQLNGNR